MAESPTVQRRRLGQLLRQFRNDTDRTTRDLGAALERSESWVSRVESGESGIRLGELRSLLDVLGVTDHAIRLEMEDLARGGRQRGWWSRYRSALDSDYAAYIGFEASARRLLVYETLVVHGLLQTEDYARGLILAAAPDATAALVNQRVQVRMTRQQLLTKEPTPLELWAVFDEAALHRVIRGDVATHLAQLDQLVEVAQRPNVRIQVVPFRDASNPGAMSGFTVLEFADLSPIAYFEGLNSDLYEEGEEANRFTLGHENLRAAALSETSTIELIKHVRDEVARKP